MNGWSNRSFYRKAFVAASLILGACASPFAWSQENAPGVLPKLGAVQNLPALPTAPSNNGLDLLPSPTCSSLLPGTPPNVVLPASLSAPANASPSILQVQDVDKPKTLPDAKAPVVDKAPGAKIEVKEKFEVKEKKPIPVAEPLPAPIMEAAPVADCVSCGGRGKGCFSCGPYNGVFGCSTCTGGGPCYAGRLGQCYDCDRCGPVSRFLCCFYECLCCPDPCYEPRWIPEANAAFWVDGARPNTVSRFRWDAGLNLHRPDIAEMFWAKSGGGGRGPATRERDVDYHEFTMYTEVASGKASFFIEQPYRTVDIDNSAGQKHEAGFGDLNLGTKSLIFDCELVQITFQFRTYILTGVPSKGLGTGHVSLEPSLLFTLKLACETYLQAQASEWIPIGGDDRHQGSTFHYHLAVNHVLGRCTPNVPVIGTLEMNGFHYQAGQFTEFGVGGAPVVRRSASGLAYYNIGAGLRISVCDRIDFGTSAVFGLSDTGPDQIYRSELRIRF